MDDVAETDLVERAHKAASRGDWARAYGLLSRADERTRLAVDDLGLLAEVAYAAGHLDVTIQAWERAHAEAVNAGDPIAAAGAATQVALHLLMDTALMAPIRGWVRRAERLLEGYGETPVHAWLALIRAYERLMIGDLPAACEGARRAIAVGSKCNPAAAALGRVLEAHAVILAGDVGRGLDLVDEAAVAIISRELDALSTGMVYCELVCMLQGSLSTTLPRSGPRPWSDGARKAASAASMAAAGCTGPRSFGYAGHPPKRSRRPWRPVPNCDRTCVGN
jgi:hypothetical protein